MSSGSWVLRSLLFVPGNRPDMIAKAGRYGADALMLDLEDGVAPDEKGRACQVVAGALEAGIPGSPIVFLRVNGSGSGLLARDLREAFRPGAAAVCLPKCESPEEVVMLDASLRAVEFQHRLPGGGTRILPMVEGARGVVQAAAIAASHARVCGLAFGAEDYTADLGVRRTRQGAEIAYPRAAVSVAAHAAGVDAVAGIYADFRDADGLRADAGAARALGYTGKMLIHPAQVAPVHAAFAPEAAEVEQARRIVAAFEAAGGSGIVVVDGAMVDRPVVLRARRTLAIASRPAVDRERDCSRP